MARTDLTEALPRIGTSLLADGETLLGTCVATWQKSFSGRSVVIATTDRRVIVQPMDRRFEADGDPISLTLDRIATAKVTGGGNGGILVENAVMDAVSIAATIRTTDGITLKLLAMHGDGPLGGLSGGEVQWSGVEAFVERLTAR